MVHLIEKDTDLAFELKNKFSNFKNVKVYNADILKFNVEKNFKQNDNNFW